MVVTYSKTITFSIEYGEGKGEANRINSIIASLEAAGCKVIRIQQGIDRIDGKPRITYPNRVD